MEIFPTTTSDAAAEITGATMTIDEIISNVETAAILIESPTIHAGIAIVMIIGMTKTIPSSSSRTIKSRMICSKITMAIDPITMTSSSLKRRRTLSAMNKVHLTMKKASIMISRMISNNKTSTNRPSMSLRHVKLAILLTAITTMRTTMLAIRRHLSTKSEIKLI